MDQRGIRRDRGFILLALVLGILWSLSVSATHQTVQVQVIPVETGPIFVGEDFDAKVLLQLPEGTTSSPLYGASLRFMIEGVQIAYRAQTGSTDSDINLFEPLAQNEKINNLEWVLEGSSDTPYTLTATAVRLGTIPLKAPVSGPARLNLITFASSIVQDLPSGGEEHKYTIASAPSTIATILEHICGDGFVSGTEQCDNGQANSNTLPNACRTTCVNPGCGDGVIDTGESCDDGNVVAGDGCSGSCIIEDADGDGVTDSLDNPQCQSTPTGFTVADGKVYQSGQLAGCIIGDVNLDQQLNSNDISSFIFEYNHRTDGFEAAADLTQDNLLDSNDISSFIFSYNHRSG